MRRFDFLRILATITEIFEHFYWTMFTMRWTFSFYYHILNCSNLSVGEMGSRSRRVFQKRTARSLKLWQLCWEANSFAPWFDVFCNGNLRICKEKKIVALFDVAYVIIVGWNVINWIRFMSMLRDRYESIKLRNENLLVLTKYEKLIMKKKCRAA